MCAPLSCKLSAHDNHAGLLADPPHRKTNRRKPRPPKRVPRMPRAPPTGGEGVRVVSDEGLFESPLQAEGDWSYTFEETGTDTRNRQRQSSRGQR